MSEALRFLALAELLGLAALAPALVLFSRLPAGAAAFAKPLGLLAAGGLAWLGGLAGIDFGFALCAAGMVAVIGGGAVAASRLRIRGRAALKRAGFWEAELAFLVGFAAIALVTSFAPAVWGTEKPMDMALVNAVLASDALPPQNPWLSGVALDGYYYVGHVLVATAIELTGVAPAVGYNLALALLYGVAASAAFGIGSALAAGAGRPRRVGGVLAIALLLVAGNPAGASALLRLDGPLEGYDWFGTSRVVPGTINEFPAFSWLLGDLHAHVIAVPFTLLALAFALQWFSSGARTPDIVAAGVVTGLLPGINAWSYPVVCGLLVVSLAVGTGAGRTTEPAAGGPRPVAAVGMLVLVSLVVAAPFLVSFDGPAGGLAAVTAREPLWAFLGDAVQVSGVAAWLTAAAYAGVALAAARHSARRLALVVATASIGIAVAEAVAGLGGAALALGAAAVAAGRLLAGPGSGGERFLWLTAFGAATCVLLPELMYVRDAFAEGPLERMNTVFKLGYQAWLLLALAGTAAVLVALPRLPRPLRTGWACAGVALGLAAAAFPVAGAYARTDGFAGPPTLDGRAWLARQAPGDVAAIEWLVRHAAEDAVVLETAGPDYSPAGHGRISTFTGRPTVLGWSGHVVQWGEDPGPRARDVAMLYETTSPERAQRLLAAYGVDYVVVGPLERADHGTGGAAKWAALGTRVLDREGTVLWRIHGRSSPPAGSERSSAAAGPPRAGSGSRSAWRRSSDRDAARG